MESLNLESPNRLYFEIKLFKKIIGDRLKIRGILMLTPQVSVVLGILILIFGVIAGFSDFSLSYRILHLSIASVYILLTPLIIYVHSKRFYTKGPLDWIAWMHFILFGLILFITVKMLKKWLPKRHYHHKKEDKGLNSS